MASATVMDVHTECQGFRGKWGGGAGKLRDSSPVSVHMEDGTDEVAGQMGTLYNSAFLCLRQEGCS